MRVDTLVEVQVNKLRAVFPMTTKPPLSLTDFIGEYASSGFPRYDANGLVVNGSDGGMEFDPIAKVVHPRAMFLPHDQMVGSGGTGGYGYGTTDCVNPDSGNLTFTWAFPPRDSLGTWIQKTPTVEPGFKSLRLEENSGPNASFAVLVDGAPCVAAQAFTALMKFAPPTFVGGFICASGFRWRVVGSGNGTHRWYEVTWQSGDAVWFRYNDVNNVDGSPDDAHWQDVSQIDQNSNVSDLVATEYVPAIKQDPPNHDLYVKVMGGIMQVVVDGATTPFVWSHDLADADGNPDWVIDYWQMIAFDVVMVEWSVHPTKWRANSVTVSNELNLGFVPSDHQLSTMKLVSHLLPCYRKADGARADYTNQYSTGFRPPGPSGAFVEFGIYDYTTNTFTPGVTAGTTGQYQLQINNAPIGDWKGFRFSDFTSAVSAVTVDFSGDTYWEFNAPVILGTPGSPSNPSTMSITHTFDLDRLTISSVSSMTFRNFTGAWTNSSNTGILDTRGHMAATVALGIAEYGTIRTEWTGIWNTEFSNSWGGGGNDNVIVSGCDLSMMLRVPVFNLPWMDGWNIYYAMAFLAAMGTVDPSLMGFSALIPNDPYDPSPGLPDDQNYYLGDGPAGTPLTRFSGGQPIWDIMLKISRSIGFCLFFNVYGILQFEKFMFAPSPSAIKTFQYVAGAFGGGAGLDEIFSGEYKSGLIETRNSVTVIGVNALGPLWNPVVAWDTDNDSVFNSLVANYKGYPDPVVWVDNLFANQAFALSAATAMLDLLRLADKSVRFSTWYPGDIGIYPGSYIAISYPRSAASCYLFWVVSTTTTVGKGQIPRMDITARLIPPSS